MVLALSLGQFVGFAVGDLAGDRPRFGAWRLSNPEINRGRALIGFENELITAIKMHRPNSVVWSIDEALCNLGVDPALFAVKLEGAAENACERWKVRAFIRRGEAVRTTMLGKEASIARFGADSLLWCNRKGWAPPETQSASAGVLWAFEARTKGAR